MTDLQLVEYEMLKELIAVCEKLNLKYYLVCGSALGAIKYKGFIPWDDDIDVALPRKDYERLFTEGQQYLNQKYFLQSYQTDTMFPLISGKMRDVTTTFIEKCHSTIDMVHGVYIDIFPLDGYPKTESEKKKFVRVKKYFERRRVVNITYKRFNNNIFRGFVTNVIYLLHKYCKLYSNTSKLLDRYTSFISSFSTEESEIWCNHHEEYSTDDYNFADCYGQGFKSRFEEIEVMVPFNYDMYLTKRYGDWKSDIPEEKKVGHHNAIIIDCSHSYKTHIKSLPNGQIEIIG